MRDDMDVEASKAEKRGPRAFCMFKINMNI
jgi:hypothetical protein